MTESKIYSDGAVATGPSPLPAQSPAQQESIVGLVDEYGNWMWDSGYMDDPRGEALVDQAADRRKEIADAIEVALTRAYAEGRKDQAEVPSSPSELRVGKYRLWQNVPSKTSIYRDDGEGGVFNTADLEQAIGQFYGQHF